MNLEVEKISKEEVRENMKRMKNGKAGETAFRYQFSRTTGM